MNIFVWGLPIMGWLEGGWFLQSQNILLLLQSSIKWEGSWFSRCTCMYECNSHVHIWILDHTCEIVGLVSQKSQIISLCSWTLLFLGFLMRVFIYVPLNFAILGFLWTYFSWIIITHFVLKSNEIFPYFNLTVNKGDKNPNLIQDR